jgi:hypothetical protein
MTAVRAALLGAVALAAACAHERSGPAPAPGAVSLPRQSTGPDQQPGWELPLAAYRSERDRCIDRELAARQLNAFGDPQGTTYSEGSPLEVAKGANRYDYVMRHRRDIGAACSRAPGESPR